MLSADRNTPSKPGVEIVVAVAASTKIFAGAIVAANATGYATKGAKATTLTYLGRAEEYCDNSDGADGDVSIRVRRKSAFLWANSATDAVTQADLGKTAYIEDDQTVSATSGSSTQSAAGTVIGIDDNGVWID